MSGRAMGWVDLPLKCPHCAKRIRENLVMSYGGAIRCVGCERLLYVALASNLNMAFVITLNAAELVDLRRRALSLPQILAHFHATFPGST